LAEGTEMKLSGDKGLTMSIPKFHLDKLSGEAGGLFGGGGGLSLGGTPPSVPAPVANPSPGAIPVPTMPNLPAPAPVQQQAGRGLLNPSGSLPEISRSALAGLSPENISAALQGVLNIEGLNQDKLKTLIDKPYKEALTIRNLAESARILQGEPLDRPYPIPVPGIGDVTVREWSNLPTEQKQYAAYKNLEKLGEGVDLSYEEFLKEYDKTDREKFLRAAMGDEDLMSAAKDLAKSGATRISLGEKLEEVKEKGKLAGQVYFSDPKWPDDLTKHMSSKPVRQKIADAPDAEGEAKARKDARIEYIESKIKTGGEILSIRYADDGRTMIWKVKWNSGDIEEVQYVVRD